jgi:hypothetical protein
VADCTIAEGQRTLQFHTRLKAFNFFYSTGVHHDIGCIRHPHSERPE